MRTIGLLEFMLILIVFGRKELTNPCLLDMARASLLQPIKLVGIGLQMAKLLSSMLTQMFYPSFSDELLEYLLSPNASMRNIAGVCDPPVECLV